MRRAAAQSVLLLLLGGTLLKIAWTGTYVRYVKVGQHGYLLAAGAVLVLVGAANLVHLLWTARRPQGDHGHGHVHRGFEPSGC